MLSGSDGLLLWDSCRNPHLAGGQGTSWPGAEPPARPLLGKRGARRLSGGPPARSFPCSAGRLPPGPTSGTLRSVALSWPRKPPRHVPKQWVPPAVAQDEPGHQGALRCPRRPLTAGSSAEDVTVTPQLCSVTTEAALSSVFRSFTFRYTFKVTKNNAIVVHFSRVLCVSVGEERGTGALWPAQVPSIPKLCRTRARRLVLQCTRGLGWVAGVARGRAWLFVRLAAIAGPPSTAAARHSAAGRSPLAGKRPCFEALALLGSESAQPRPAASERSSPSASVASPRPSPNSPTSSGLLRPRRSASQQVPPPTTHQNPFARRLPATARTELRDRRDERWRQS